METNRTGNANNRAQHSLEERLQRACSPEVVLDGTLELLAHTWDLVSPSEFASLYRRVRTRTMCSNARLRGLYNGVQYVVRNQIPGDFVECGCAMGGSAALIGLTLSKLRSKRAMWLFDTFQGLPAPTPEDPDFHIAARFTGTCVGELAEVRGLFEELQIAEQVQLVKGLFQETLPATPVSQIALLHIDGDWYESVKVCLENLYDRVTPGGVIQFDDYGYWQGARKAVDEFFAIRGISIPLSRLDYSGRSMVKPHNREARTRPQ